MAKNTPIVSIIIPTYNQEHVIANAIGSALAQDYQNLEIIVADDCSKDRTGEIIQNYRESDTRIKYYCNSQNLGRVGNYRKALYEYASGEYVLNLDGDDLLTDNTFISTAVKVLNDNNAKPPLMYIACKQCNTNNTLVKLIHKTSNDNHIIDGIDFTLNLYTKYYFSHLTTVYNREKALEMDFYRKDIISSDKESLLRLAIEGNVYISKKIVGQWNSTETSASQQYELNDVIRNLEWIEIVSKELEKRLNRFRVLFWNLKAKYFYSYPIIMSLKQKKNRKLKDFKFIFIGGLWMVLPTYILAAVFNKALKLGSKPPIKR